MRRRKSPIEYGAQGVDAKNFTEALRPNGVSGEILACLKGKPPNVTGRYAVQYENVSFLFNAFTQASAEFGETGAPLINEDTSELTAKSVLGEKFLGLLNTSKSRPGVQGLNFALREPSEGFANACASAESKFEASLTGHGLTNPNDVAKHQARVIFVDKDDNPTIFRKGLGESLALSLKPISLKGAIFPEGTIFDASVDPSLPPNHGQTLVLGNDAIEGLWPKRLSLFAIPASRNNYHYAEQPELEQASGNAPGALTIETISQLIMAQIMEKDAERAP